MFLVMPFSLKVRELLGVTTSGVGFVFLLPVCASAAVMEAESTSPVLDSVESDAMSSVLASVSTRKEKAAKAVASLHSHRNLLTACITEWEELERSFGVAERALQQKFKELAEREKEYDSRIKDVHAAIDKRGESIAGREESSLARVKEQKDSALAFILEERRKVEEELLKMTGGKKENDLQVIKETDLPISKEAECETGTQNSTETQRKKNSNIAKALKETKDMHKQAANKSSAPSENNKKEKELLITKSGQKEDQKNQSLEAFVKSKRKDVICADETAAKRSKEVPVSEAKAVEDPKNDRSSNSVPLLEEAIDQVKPFAGAPEQIKSFVNRMDANGLRDLLVNNRKQHQEIRPQLQAALLACTDPCHLVLMVLEGSEGTNRVSANSKSGHACILLLECLSEVMADPVLGIDYPVVPSDVKELAKTMARRWKAKLDSLGQDGYTLDSHIFLQLLATFGIGSDYSDEELLTYIVAMSRRSIGPSLCRTLGLTNVVPGLIEKLVKEGKQLEAIAYSSAFGMLEKFRPEFLLKSHLEDCQKAMQSHNTLSSGNAVSNTYAKQISALKNAIKVIEEYNLSSQFSVEDLQKRIAVLTQEKEESKKGNLTMKEDQKLKSEHDVQSSRPNGIRSSEGGDGRPGLHTFATSYGSTLDRGHYPLTDVGWSGIGDYLPSDLRQSFGPPVNADIPYKYDRRPMESSYASHGLGSRSPVSIPNSYRHPSRDDFMSGSLSHLPSYAGMSRDEIDMLSGRRTSYTGIPGSSRNYNLGPSSSHHLPYY